MIEISRAKSTRILIFQSCWNCGRPALETCGGCGIARYCGSFCQHRDWEAGHHTTCNNLPPRESRRSSSRSPPRVTAANLSTNVNDVDVAPVPSAGASKGKWRRGARNNQRSARSIDYESRWSRVSHKDSPL